MRLTATERALRRKRYLFLRLYSVDLGEAHHSLDILDGVTDPDIRMCILRDIVVNYVRPFSGNKGRGRQRHFLQRSLRGVIRARHKALHADMMRYRMKLFAHTDLSAYGPKAVRWVQAGGTPTFPMTFWMLAYDTLNARVPRIRELVESVEASLNAEIARIHEGI